MGDHPANMPHRHARRAPGSGHGPSGHPAQKALARRAALCRARPRHQQLPAADRAAAGRGLRGGRRLFADRPAGRGAGVERAAVRRGDRPHHRRAAGLRRQAAPPQRARSRARSRPKRAASAANGAEFIARAYRETGIRLDIISAEEEARLAVLGCHALIEPGDGPALIFDIGGGSTELVLIDAQRPRAARARLAFGAMGRGVADRACRRRRAADRRAARGLCANAATGDRELRAVRRAAAASRRSRRGCSAPAGTVTTLASVHLGLDHYDRALVDGLIVPATAMRADQQRSVGHVARRTRGAARASAPSAPTWSSRAARSSRSILDLWPAERLGVADRGIREGILRRLMGANRP